ncbi:serine protease [Gigaspora margarita]|uniref:Serine protease n=1 Tax=Gigaspora margarita TaxID=4874 RepID=A0A8H4EU38_GIGMA|nr:serine protease [Gigaspora margarita]
MKNHSNPNAPNPNAPPKPPLQVYVLGGDGIHNSEFSAFCTAGFWVGSKSNSTFYLMTAAHCSKRGPFNPDGTVDFYHLPWGSEGGGLLVGSMFAPNMSAIEVDMGLIMKQNNRISVTPSVRNTDDQEFPELRIYGIVEMDTVRTLVCKSAYITHATCGKIISFNVRVINQSGREFNGLIKIEELSCQGESGAPLFPFVEEMFPGIFITGMITSGKVGSACYAVPIGRLITGDMYILTVNDLI